jgi:hypothetical protein
MQKKKGNTFSRQNHKKAFFRQKEWTSTIKLFTTVIDSMSLQARVFAIVFLLHSRLKFEGKARSLPLEWSPIWTPLRLAVAFPANDGLEWK